MRLGRLSSGCTEESLISCFSFSILDGDWGSLHGSAGNEVRTPSPCPSVRAARATERGKSPAAESRLEGPGRTAAEPAGCGPDWPLGCATGAGSVADWA